MNAFNSATWSWNQDTLAKLGVLVYLFRITENYILEELLLYEKDDSPGGYVVTGSIPQVSVSWSRLREVVSKSIIIYLGIMIDA